MNRRLLIILVAAIILLPLAWWLGSPLFLNRTVDEAFPFELPSAEEQADMSPEEIEASLLTVMDELSREGAMDDMDDATKAQLEERVMALSADMPDKNSAEAMPDADNEWQLVASGTFQDANAFHKGSGSATIFQQGDKRILRFEEFSSTNGPDLHVLLVENIEGTSSGELGTYLDLGSLKGNIGNQNYDIPEDTDLSIYEGVMIYCMPFHVVFSTASFNN